MMKWLLVLIVIAACTHFQKDIQKSVRIGESSTLILKEPKDILPEIQLVQLLSIEHRGEKNSTQTILTSRDNKITVVALMPFGGELFRIEYFDGEIHSKAVPFINSDFDLKYALADLVLVYSDKNKIVLSSGTTISDRKNERIVIFNNLPLIKIKYSSKDKFKSIIDYEHLTRNYKIKITPVSQGVP